jgi:acyl-CoA synthetase (AMP-forming)/AMP-acid ligase II
MQVVLQALLGGSTLLVPPIQDVDACVDFLIEERCTSLSATPSMWRKLFSASRIARLAPRQIALGGEICDGKTLARLTSLFPAARIAHIYASTEAGVGFSVRDGKPGFPRSYLEATPGREIRLKIDSRGVLRIRGRRDEQEYVDQPGHLVDEDGFVDTGDLVGPAGDRILFLGRADGLINVGGQKVMPEEIERILRTCPSVREVRVYAKPNPVLGNVVAADVVVEDPGIETEARRQMAEACRAALDPFKRPAIIRIVGDIALSGAGKIQRTT